MDGTEPDDRARPANCAKLDYGAQLLAEPGLVKTMSVSPPMGQGRVRLIAIGEGADQIDLQPCGGTHVARTGEIGYVTIGKIQNMGRQNRRVYLHLDP